jgi:activator of HSP90 ATPase
MTMQLLSRRDFSLLVTSLFPALGIAGSVLASSGIAVANAAADQEISRSAESIHQEIVLKASRNRVYAALTDARQFSKITELGGMEVPPAEISSQVGGSFSLFGGHIVGRHVELLPNQRIVQAWRVVDWPVGVYSIAKFDLQDQGSNTKIVFDHTGFPVGLAEHLAEGWNGHYWEPLAKYLA